MHFFGTTVRVAHIPEALLERARGLCEELGDSAFNYRDVNTQTGESSWWRIDGWLKKTHNPALTAFESLAFEICEQITQQWEPARGAHLSYFNVSGIRPHETIEDHVDPKLLNKLSYRVLVPINPSLPYRYKWIINGEPVFSEIEYGHAYHFNNNDIHAAFNDSDQFRVALMYDLCDPRLFAKFAKTRDWTEGLVFGTVNKHFLKRHGSKNVY